MSKNHYLIALTSGLILIAILSNAYGAKTGYESNKSSLKDKVKDGGWTVAWADDIAEVDVATGITSIFGGPETFVAWCQNLITRTVDSLIASGAQKFPQEILSDVQKLVQDIITAAVNGKSFQEAIKRYDKVDFKAGAIKYSGKNLFLGKTVSTTWGIKPYVAFRWKIDQPLVGSDLNGGKDELTDLLWAIQDNQLGWVSLDQKTFHPHMPMNGVTTMTAFDGGGGVELWAIQNGWLGWVSLDQETFHKHMQENSTLFLTPFSSN